MHNSTDYVKFLEKSASPILRLIEKTSNMVIDVSFYVILGHNEKSLKKLLKKS